MRRKLLVHAPGLSPQTICWVLVIDSFAVKSTLAACSKKDTCYRNSHWQRTRVRGSLTYLLAVTRHVVANEVCVLRTGVGPVVALTLRFDVSRRQPVLAARSTYSEFGVVEFDVMFYVKVT